jgi:hypothetical protein
MKSYGNEEETMRFIFRNLNSFSLPHIGLIKNLSVPHKNGELVKITNEEDLDYFSSSDSRKKADFYLNDFGISHKQSGGCQLFNRLQRHDLLRVFDFLNFNRGEELLSKLDRQIDLVHFEQKARNRAWDSCFCKDQFQILLNFLMTEGSPNYGISSSKVDFILNSPKVIKSTDDLKVYNFQEYFNQFSDQIKIAVRRCWMGQGSKTESQRAISLNRKEENRRWIFDSIVGEPKFWDNRFPKKERKTAYYLMIEQTN